MRINHLSILNYKNLEQVDFFPTAKINCLVGLNGMGKTNILDVIYYLSFCKSFTNTSDNLNIKHDADFAMIQGKYQNEEKVNEYLCSIKRKQKKQFKHNKKEYEKLAEHIGKIPLVLISPSDSELISGAGDERRKFIDMFLSQFNKTYLQNLINYNKTLLQRNALLRSREIKDNSLLDILDEQLCNLAEYIYETRKKFIDDFIPKFQEIYSFISPSLEKVSLIYKSHLSNENFATLLHQNRNKDKEKGYTNFGVHRDDIGMLINNYPIKKEGSQGQNKTFVIALKLAQFAFLKNTTGITPLLLLDDIFDKLDANRVQKIVELVMSKDFGQIFITDTNRDHIDDILSKSNIDHSIYYIENGTITKK